MIRASLAVTVAVLVALAALGGARHPPDGDSSRRSGSAAPADLSRRGSTAAEAEWPSYGHDPGGTRYSPADQITRENVGRLAVAWTFHTGDIAEGKDGGKRTGFETTPIVVDDTMYLTTGFNRVIALDPQTGVEKWAYDPRVDRHGDYGDGLINRGVATWLDRNRDSSLPCRRCSPPFAGTDATCPSPCKATRRAISTC